MEISRKVSDREKEFNEMKEDPPGRLVNTKLIHPDEPEEKATVSSYGFGFVGPRGRVRITLEIPDRKGVYQDASKMNDLIRAIQKDVNKYLRREKK